MRCLRMQNTVLRTPRQQEAQGLTASFQLVYDEAFGFCASGQRLIAARKNLHIVASATKLQGAPQRLPLATPPSAFQVELKYSHAAFCLRWTLAPGLRHLKTLASHSARNCQTWRLRPARNHAGRPESRA